MQLLYFEDSDVVYKIMLRIRRRRHTWVITGGWDLWNFTVWMQFQI